MPRDGNLATAVHPVAVAPPRGRAWVPLGVGVALVLALPYGAVLRELVEVWYNDPYYSYGFLIAPWSAWLMVGARREVLRRRARPDPLGLAMAVAGLALLLAARSLDSLTLAALSLPVVLGGLGLFALGREAMGPLWFPLAFLVFMAPLPAGVVPWLSWRLQEVTAAVSAATLAALGIPFTREGVFIHLQEATVHVSEACNGLRFLLAMAVMGVAFGWAVGRRLRTRALLVVVALGSAVVGNFLRVTATTLLVHAWGPQAAVGLFHNLFGKAVYLAVLAAFFLFVLHLRNADARA